MPTRLRAERLDPESQALLRYLNLAQGRSATRVPDVRQMRRRWKLAALAFGRRTPVAAVEHRRIEGPAGPLRVRIYRPAARGAPGKLPVFLFFHGGGFVMGGVGTADSICRAIAERSGAVVVTAQYRLAPEHGLHAGRDDSLTVYDWIVREADALGIDASRTAFGGDSAGGNLAAVLAQRIAQRGKSSGRDNGVIHAMRLQVLVYPATNLRDTLASKAENAEGYLLTAANIEWFETQFAAGLDTADPLVSPALAQDLRGLPPALVVSAGFDPIRDDGLAYADLLRAAGVPVQLLHYGGQFHGFVNFDAVLHGARDALDRIGDALATAFAGERAPDRTIEIGTGGRTGPALLGGALRDAMVGSLMLAEWTEHARNTLAASMMPTAARGWLAYPVWNVASQWRSMWVSALAPLEARQTHGPMGRETQ